MRKLLVFAGVVLSAAAIFAGSAAIAQHTSARFMAFCTDGDGDLSGWVTNRYEAFVAGRDHERSARGHRWEVMVQQGETAPERFPSCSLITPGKREGTIGVVNTCSGCRVFRLQRIAPDRDPREREFSFQPGASRYFRTHAGEINVLGERDCGDQTN